MENLKHVAIIMDGNGRWAKNKGKKRIEGHFEGSKRIKEIAIYAADKYKLDALTVYAFSTENWKRPSSEVDYIFKLPSIFFDAFLKDFIKHNISIDFIGDLESIPDATYKVLMRAKKRTAHCTGMKFIFAINYGSRIEIIDVVKKIVESGAEVENITEQLFESYLMTKSLPVLDLVIRSSGEQRLSNFLLWQCAYSEFYFDQTLWPDYTIDRFDLAIEEFHKRKRRFGGV